MQQVKKSPIELGDVVRVRKRIEKSMYAGQSLGLGLVVSDAKSQVFTSNIDRWQICFSDGRLSWFSGDALVLVRN